MNVVALVGRLTKDPELKWSNSGVAICNATLAVDRPVKQGEEKKADFIRIILFGKTAETFSKYLAKGRQVALEGRIQTGSYKNQKGDTVYTTDVIVNRFDFVGNNNSNSAPAPETPAASGFEEIDDDVPF